MPSDMQDPKSADSASKVTDRLHEVQARMTFQAAFLVFLIPVAWLLPQCNRSPHIIRQTINVSSIGRRLDTKLHEQMTICVNSMLCLMARPQIHLPNVKTCLDVVNTYTRVVIAPSFIPTGARRQAPRRESAAGFPHVRPSGSPTREANLV